MLQRILSALVLAPIVLAIVWFGGWWTTGLIAVAVVIAIKEIAAMFRAGTFHPRIELAALAALGFVAAAVYRVESGTDLTLAVVAGATLAALSNEVLRRERTGALEAWAVTLASALYTGGLLSHFVLLRALEAPGLAASPLSDLGLPVGAAWIFAVFAVTWASDSGAYFAGRAFGKHKMAPVLSPKKTWEGFAGGTLASVLAALGIVALTGLDISLGATLALGVIGAAGGTIGDLAESLLKRQAGVKDSGALIPGHGGLLDRIDSLLFTGPLVYYLALLAA